MALVLRLPGLLTFDLWQDEIYSIYEAKYLYHSPIGPGGMELRPLYFLLLHPLADAWPHATAWLRLPSLLFGMVGLWTVWWLARTYAGRHAAMVTLVVATLLPFAINAAQMLRWISFVFLIGAALTRTLLRSLETDEPRHHLLTLGLVLAGSLTHITFLMPQTGLVLGAHLVRDDGRLGFRRPTRRALLLCWLPYLALLGLYYGVLFAVVPADRLLGDATGGSVGRLLPAVFYQLTPPLMATAGIGGWWLLGTGAPAARRLALMTALGLALPTLLMQLLGLRNLVPVSVLYLSAAVPVFLVAVGAAVNGLTPGRAGGRAALALAFILAFALLPGTVSYLADGSRFEFRQPLRRVQERDAGATVLVYPVIHARWETPKLDAVEFRTALGTAFLDSLAGARDHFWFVVPLRRAGMPGDGDGAKYRWIVRHCDLQGAWRRPRFDYERYDTELFRCPSLPSR